MVLKLYAANDSKAKRILICATYNKVAIDAPPAGASADGKMPVLETEEGCVFSTNAIARYVARMRRDSGMYGQTFIESGAIDGWVEFCTHELEVPMCVLVYPKLGKFEEVPAATAQAKIDVSKALTILNKHLESNTYMVGHQVTLADVTLLTVIADGFVHALDGAFRSQFPNLLRWFNTLIDQPEVLKVLGQVTCLGDKPGAKGKASPKKAPASPKKAAAKASPKKAAAPAPAAPAGDSPALEALKKQIADKKAELKKGGMSGGQINKDPEVAKLVAKLQELKSAPAAPAAAAPAKASPKKGASPQKAAAAPAGDSPELEALKKQIADKKAELKKGGMSGGQINKDPEVQKLVERLQQLKAAPAAAAPAAKASPKKAAAKSPKKGAAPAPAATPEAAKLAKVVTKEGGKKGSEIAGAADMGGMSFMNVSVDSPEGDLDLMKMLVDAMNTPVEEGAEETKGGAGHVGKMLFSYGPTQVGILANIPDEVKDKVNAKKWMEQTIKSFGKQGKVVKAEAQFATAVVLGDGDKGLFPIKLKDEALQNSIKYLQEIGVFPTGGDSDSEEMVFGDDDFPCG